MNIAGHRVEIIHTRDPDEGCDHLIFVDGVLVDEPVEIYDVDPGRGYTLSDWQESTEAACQQASPAVASMLRSIRDDAAQNSTYIERTS